MAGGHIAGEDQEQQCRYTLHSECVDTGEKLISNEIVQSIIKHLRNVNYFCPMNIYDDLLCSRLIQKF